MSGSFKAAAATQSVAALTLDDSRAVRSFAKAVEAINSTAIPKAVGRYFDILTSQAIG
jgi:hypothetical protein